MSGTLVSVVVPVYNCANYLSECIQSIAVQSYSNLEIILVDDGSTDGSSEICDELAEADDRINVLHFENRGVSAARNEGYRIARGEWLLFVDADDKVKPSAIERMLSLANGADIVSFGVDAVTESGMVIWEKIPRGIEATDEEGLIREIVQGPLEEYLFSYLFRREAINNTQWGQEPFVEGCGLYEDAWSLERLLRSGSFHVVFLPESLYLYRQVAGSASRRHDPRLAEDGIRAIRALNSMSIPADIADMWHAKLLQMAFSADWSAGPGYGDGQRDLHARIAEIAKCQARAGGIKGSSSVGRLKYLLFCLGLFRPLKRVSAWIKGLSRRL